MRSPLGALATLANKTPVPYIGRSQLRLPMSAPVGRSAELRMMGAVGTLFAIVNRTSNATAQVDWKLYRKAASGKPEDRVEITRHAALDLWNRPNPFMPRQEFVEAIQQHLDLTGESWWVIAKNPRSPMPLELWPVRPDRMLPVPDADDFLRGYIYQGPDGREVPLGLDEVIQLRMPNPLDPYRGMGPVQTILSDLDGSRYSAEWNRNFFLNSAEPGGIIEVERRLSDDEFEELSTRWREQHQGVANAHRVAILEQGKWVSNKFSQRDMQFTELRAVSREVIREAFGIHKHMLGGSDDVNRANAEAASVDFARWLIVPRLERIKAALNHDLLPKYGLGSDQLEFDYANPVPDDREAADRERVSKANAAATLISAGAYGPEVLAAFDLPEIAFGQPGADPKRELLIKLVERAPLLASMILPMLGYEIPAPAAPPAPVQPPQPAPVPAQAARLDIHHHSPLPAAELPSGTVSLYDLQRARSPHTRPATVRDAADDNADPDIAGVLTDLEDALGPLLTDWEPILATQISDLTDQIKTAVDNDTADALAALSVDNADAIDLLRVALGQMAQTAADRMAEECAAQGVNVAAPRIDEALTALSAPRVTAFGAELADIALTVAELLATDLTASAGREALRLYGPGADGAHVAAQVRGFLTGLKGALRKSQLGAALHRATNIGRLATLKLALKVRKDGKIFATEENDTNTCGPCKDVDGYEFADLADADAVYGIGGYYACLGRERCRGTFKAVWD